MKTYIIAAIALLAAACSSDEAKTELPESPAAAAQGAPIEVETVRVTRQPLELPITATGTARPVREADLAAAISARVTAVLVEEGQDVKKGQALVKLDTASTRLGAAQAKASARAAQTQATQLAADHDRLAPLAERGTVPQSRVDQLASQRDAAEAQAAAARSAASAAQRVVADSTLRAPFAGTVTEIPIEVGEIASMGPGSTLVRIIDLSQLEVTVPVPERDLARLAAGDPATARFPNLGVDAEGTVLRVALELDPATRTAEVIARIPNPGKRLPAGLFAELSIQPSTARDAIVIPAAAVGGGGTKTYVFAVKDGVAVRTAVEVAPLDSDRVEVVSGLEDGATIVAGNVERVIDGSKIAVAGAEPRTTAKNEPAKAEPAENEAKAEPAPASKPADKDEVLQ